MTLRLLPVLGGLAGVSNRSVGVELRDAPEAPLFPLDKGKGKEDLIKYPGGVRIPKIRRSACFNCGT